MLIIEDEKDILAEGSTVLVPLLVSEADGEIEMEAYAGIEEIAVDFHSRFGESPFTKAAIDWLDEKLLPYVKELGYLRECTGKYRYYYQYELTDSSRLPKELILPSTVLLTDGDYDVKVSFSLVEQMEKALPTYVTLLGNRIVSVATVNEHDPQSRVLEVTVETCPEYRGFGYATSNTVALAKDLAEKGYRVAYVASRYNRSSQKVALRSGFTKVGRFYAYTAYRL